jgi:hypothetical protein
MIRTFLIYLAVLTAAEFGSSHRAHADSEVAANASTQSAVTFESMAPVHADGTNVAPQIMDFTKDPDADRSAMNPRHLKKMVSKR